MKSYHLFIAISMIGLLGACQNTATTDAKEPTAIEAAQSIPYLGEWTRNFDMGEGVTQHVFYRISEDHIEYEMQGAMSVKYELELDTFIASDNRWIGTRADDPYVIFVKNITTDSFALFKQKVESREEALGMAMPSDTASGRFTTWNVFQKVVVAND